MRGLKGRTAIVTGGAAGIGAAIVQRFRDEGTRVEIFDLNATRRSTSPTTRRCKAPSHASGRSTSW